MARKPRNRCFEVINHLKQIGNYCGSSFGNRYSLLELKWHSANHGEIASGWTQQENSSNRTIYFSRTISRVYSNVYNKRYSCFSGSFWIAEPLKKHPPPFFLTCLYFQQSLSLSLPILEKEILPGVNKSNCFCLRLIKTTFRISFHLFICQVVFSGKE